MTTTEFKYLIQDVTGDRETWMTNPVQDAAPFYLGLGPEVPTGTFMHDGRAYEVIRTVEVGSVYNPFPMPVVMSRRISVN